MTRDIIEEKLRRNHISAAADLPERLAAYLEILQDWNSRMDLTADSGDEELLDRLFAGTRQLFEHIRDTDIPGIRMEELSMGMSGDYRIAARHGATMVRVGSAIFGPRG